MNLKAKFGLFHYNIGFFDSANIFSKNIKIQWMQHKYKDRFFADPFILDVNNSEIQVLVEEFIYSEWKGRISLLVIDRQSLQLKSIQVLLNLESHLSFPFIFRENDELFIIPENAESGNLSMYLYDSKAYTLRKVRTILKEPVIDPVILYHNQKYFLYGSLKDKDTNGSLYGWVAKDLHDIFNPILHAPIITGKLSQARRGGDFFTVNGQLYSAVQSCVHSYGEALHICNVNILEDGLLQEDIITTLLPTVEYSYGLHTFNKYQDLCVVDGLTYLFKPLRKIYHILQRS